MPFQFHAGHRLPMLTDRRARNLRELLDHLREAPASSIFHHTLGRDLRHPFRPHPFSSDFAGWVSRGLQVPSVARQLNGVAPLDYTSIEALRQAFIDALQSHDGKLRDCAPGDEFHFCATTNFPMPTGAVATGVKDFADMLGRCSDASVFFHFVEARFRLGQRTNDFSAWLDGLGKQPLARSIEQLDPNALTLAEIREGICGLCHRRLSE